MNGSTTMIGKASGSSRKVYWRRPPRTMAAAMINPMATYRTVWLRGARFCAQAGWRGGRAAADPAGMSAVTAAISAWVRDANA
jgi:hypothetical protein